MNWRTFDLNLLVVLDAVARTRSVTQAAAKLNMSQSAVSHALTRLRSTLQDDLFVRTLDGMEPTPYGVQLAAQVRAALATLRPALHSTTQFDPANSEHRFSVAADNHAVLTLAPPLAAAVAAEAPFVSLHIRPSGTLDLVEQLDRGELDLVIGGRAAPGVRFSDLQLFECGFAALVRRGHPAARAGVISHEDLGAYPHLALSSIGEGTNFIDEALAQSGLERRIVCSAPLLAAAATLVQSDMVAVMGELGAREFARSAPLEVLSLPFETPRLSTAMLWHCRLSNVPAHCWLRSVVMRVARAL